MHVLVVVVDVRAEDIIDICKLATCVFLCKTRTKAISVDVIIVLDTTVYCTLNMGMLTNFRCLFSKPLWAVFDMYRTFSFLWSLEWLFANVCHGCFINARTLHVWVSEAAAVSWNQNHFELWALRINDDKPIVIHFVFPPFEPCPFTNVTESMPEIVRMWEWEARMRVLKWTLVCVLSFTCHNHQRTYRRLDRFSSWWCTYRWRALRCSRQNVLWDSQATMSGWWMWFLYGVTTK